MTNQTPRQLSNFERTFNNVMERRIINALKNRPVYVVRNGEITPMPFEAFKESFNKDHFDYVNTYIFTTKAEAQKWGAEND